MRLGWVLLVFSSLVAGSALADPTKDPSCARVALRERMGRDVERLRKTANKDPIMSYIVESDIAPPLLGLMERLPSTGAGCPRSEDRAPSSRDCPGGACGARIDPSLAPEWAQYSELFLQARMKWREALAKLPSLRETKAKDDDAICRVRRSLASAASILGQFTKGCADKPALLDCKQKDVTLGLNKQRAELETTLEANGKRYKEKWGSSTLEKVACD